MAVAAKRRGHRAFAIFIAPGPVIRNKNKSARELNLTVVRQRSHNDEVDAKAGTRGWHGSCNAIGPVESFITAAIVLIPSAVP